MNKFIDVSNIGNQINKLFWRDSENPIPMLNETLQIKYEYYYNNYESLLSAPKEEQLEQLLNLYLEIIETIKPIEKNEMVWIFFVELMFMEQEKSENPPFNSIKTGNNESESESELLAAKILYLLKSIEKRLILLNRSIRSQATFSKNLTPIESPDCSPESPHIQPHKTTSEVKQKTLEAIGNGGIYVKGDLVLEKHVESGGIGIQINNREIVKKSGGEENEIVNAIDENQEENDNEQNEEELNYFAPTNSLQRLLSQKWFTEMRRDNKYDTAWTNAFVDALMNSEYGEGIARDWYNGGKLNRCTQIKGFLLGLLVDARVLKGSYNAIAEKVNLMDNPRSFSKYMSNGKHQPYAQWVKGYVKENS